MKRLFKLLAILVTAVFVFTSCSLFLSDSKELSLYTTAGTPESYTATGSTASRATNEELGVATELGGARIVVTKVEMVILELELEVDSDNPNSVVEDIEAGPFLFELPLDGSSANLFEGILIPEGFYEELEIEVDAPESDDEYISFFIENYPQWDEELDVSIRVTGTYQVADDPAEDFVYRQYDFNEDFEIEFEPALQITGGETSIVLAINVSTWFLNEAKTGLYNPNEITIDSDEASQVEDNIENSFESFEDSLDD
ncbi:MAG: hypothetical protein ACQEQU_07085 [Spirochaetota bacterium]